MASKDGDIMKEDPLMVICIAPERDQKHKRVLLL